MTAKITGAKPQVTTNELLEKIEQQEKTLKKVADILKEMELSILIQSSSVMIYNVVAQTLNDLHQVEEFSEYLKFD